MKINENNIAITGITVSNPYYDNSEFNKNISGSITLEFTSSGDMSDFIDESGKFKSSDFMSAVIICMRKLAGSIVDLNNNVVLVSD